MAGWLAALIVGGVLVMAGGILIGAGGMKLKRVDLTPDKTIRTLEEDVQWAKQQIR
jgi:Putative Actinobacterial Holin-X, holin superfamily III